MQYFEMPELSVLQGDDAVAALQEYIDELEENRDEDLTESQTKALIRLAKGLISTIEAEPHVCEPKRKPQMLTRLRRAITENVQSLIKEATDPVPEERVASHFNVYPSPTPQHPRII